MTGKCPYQLAYADRQNRMTSKPCNLAVTGAGLFCADHAYCADLLASAARAGYPAFVLAVIDGKPVYTVASGHSAWLGYARRHPLRRHEDLLRRLRSAVLAVRNSAEGDETREAVFRTS